MLILVKVAAILVLVWFYLSGKKQGENPIKWAITGLIGYWLSWLIANKLLAAALVGMFSKSTTIIFLITQTPILFALATVYLVRKKLIKDSGKSIEIEG